MPTVTIVVARKGSERLLKQSKPEIKVSAINPTWLDGCVPPGSLGVDTRWRPARVLLAESFNVCLLHRGFAPFINTVELGGIAYKWYLFKLLIMGLFCLGRK